MTEAPSSPEKVLNHLDKGDETQRRYRYQAAYAAVLSLNLLNDESEFEEIFLEHHEDILVKMKDTTFVGIQVKTREVKLGPFKFGENEIMDSLKHFVTTEKQFPGKFRKYVICSNCGFWQKEKDATNLVYCLNVLKQNAGNESVSDIALSKKIAKLSSETACESNFVLSVLRKVETQDWTDMDRYEATLAKAIANETGNTDQSFDVLNKAADSLINTMLRQSSLPHDSPKTAYFALLENPSAEQIGSIIQEKRITKEIVQRIITNSLQTKMAMQTLKTVEVSDLPKGMQIMELKMAKGGISAQNIDNAKDLKYSAETLLATWMHKYGSEEEEKRYQYLSVIVRNECQEAHDLAEQGSSTFGTRMLIEARKRLRSRHLEEIRHQCNDCAYEHLVGIASILTEECKIWWSKEFQVPGEAAL